MKYTVLMLSSQMGVDEGDLHPALYEKDKNYTIGKELLGDFISLGAVEMVADEGEVEVKEDEVEVKEIEPVETETKADTPAPENKALDGEPENKASTRGRKKKAAGEAEGA